MTTQGISDTRSVGDRADDVKGTVADQSGQVAGTAKEQAQQVAAEATDRARDLAGEARTQVREQTDAQRERLAGTLHELGDELRSMADRSESSGVATEVAREAADRVHGLGDYVERNRPGDLLDDVRGFARRRPGMFLLGAAAAGVLAGRLTRGAKAAVSSGGQSGAAGAGSLPTYDPVTTTYPRGAAVAPEPAVPPVGTGATPGAGALDEDVEVIAVEVEPVNLPPTGRGLP
jgi:hypothetical protein